MNTVSEAKNYLKQNWIEGVRCPCCNQHVKLYRRGISSSMAYSLIVLSKEQIGAFVHAQTYFHNRGHKYAGGGDFPKLRFWGLIEKQYCQKDDGNPHNGMYAITKKGKNFVNNLITVPKYMYIYLDKVRKQSDEQTNIIEALGNGFSYQDLMGKQIKSPVREIQTQLAFV